MYTGASEGLSSDKQHVKAIFLLLLLDTSGASEGKRGCLVYPCTNYEVFFIITSFVSQVNTCVSKMKNCEGSPIYLKRNKPLVNSSFAEIMTRQHIVEMMKLLSIYFIAKL